MIRQLPILPTILVLAAAATMVWLGFWQLGRADEKAALIAQYEAAATDETVHALNPLAIEGVLYRRVETDCIGLEWKAVAGRSAKGQSGYEHRFRCMKFPASGLHNDPQGTVVVYVAIGWSKSPNEPVWEGGSVQGMLARAGDYYKIVASQPLAGLQPLAKPNPNDLPNNHLAYAGQWFFFALTALVIYAFAVRSRLTKRD